MTEFNKTFTSICEAMSTLQSADLSHHDPIYAGLEQAALEICERYPEQITYAGRIAMYSGSTAIFNMIDWVDLDATPLSMTAFLKWASEADFDHFISCRPTIGNCLSELAVGLCGKTKLQEKLIAYIKKGPCLGDDMDALIVDAKSFCLDDVGDTYAFYARLISTVVETNAEEASRHITAALEAPLNEVAIALLLAGAQPDTTLKHSGGNIEDLGDKMLSAHERIRLISKHSPLDRYFAETHIF